MSNSAVVAKMLLWRSRLTEIQKSKQYLVMEGFGRCLLEFGIYLYFGVLNL